MLPSRSGILAEAISIAYTSLQQRQSTSLAKFFQCPHFRSSRPELLCKKGAFKNFSKFIGVSFGTGVSCEFCEILRTPFLQNTSGRCFWHSQQSRFPILILYVINRQLRREYVQFLTLVENGRAKDFIFTSIFLRVITFFVTIQMWHRIFSIFSTGPKFNETLKNNHALNNKLLIILKLFVHYLRHRFINKKIKCQDGGSYFYKNQKYRRLEKEKTIFFSFFISEMS